MKIFLQTHSFSLSKLDRKRLIAIIKLTLGRFSNVIRTASVRSHKIQNTTTKHHYQTQIIITTNNHADVEVATINEQSLTAIHSGLNQAKCSLTKLNIKSPLIQHSC